MALSGSLSTTKYEGRYLKLDWTATQDIATNTSTISWSVVGAGTSTTGAGWYMTGPVQVVINGKTVYSSSTRFKLYVGTKVASGTLKIEHNPDGSKSFSASMKAAIYEASYNKSGSGSWTLNNIPRAATITAAPDFNDEENPTITYSNLLGDSIERLSACISFTGAQADIPYRDIDLNGSEYTFNLSEEERNILRAGVTSGYSVKVYFYVRTVMDGEFYFNKVAKTFTIINGEPTIAPTVAEGNSKIAALTGSTAAYVANASIINYEVNPTVRKGATIKSISVQFGNYKGTTATGAIENVTTSGDITFTLTDSRNNKATAKIPAKVLTYMKPTVDIQEETLSTTATEIYFNVSCYWSDMWFDGTENGSGGGVYNTATLNYRYKLQDGEYGEWIAVESSEFGEDSIRHYYQVYINGLDSNSTYVIQTALTDTLTNINDSGLYIDEFTVKLTPVFDWGKDDFAVNVPLYANDKIYLGDDYTGEARELVSQTYNGTFIGKGNYDAGNGGGSDDHPGYDTYICGNDVCLQTKNGGFITINNSGPLYQDMVLEQGNDGAYAYRKWQSGLMEAWRVSGSSVTANADTAYGGIYYGTYLTLSTTGNASQFKSINSVQLTINKNGANGMWMAVVRNWSVNNGQAVITYNLFNPTKYTAEVVPCVYIIGRWY